MTEAQYNRLVGSRIRATRKEKNMTLKELGNLVGLSESTTQRYERGQIKSIDINIAKKFADALHVPAETLLGWQDKEAIPPISSAKASPHRGNRIPVLGRVAAGIPIEAVQDIEDYEDIPASWGDPREYFALKIQGHSMEPRIWDGDTVIVQKLSDADSDSVAVVLVDGEEATVKQIKKSEDGMTLIGWNPAVYPPKFYTWAEVSRLPVQILGLVREVRGKIG